MRVAIAGGSGFVGRALTRELGAAGHDVAWLSHHVGTAEDLPPESRPAAEVSFGWEDPFGAWADEIARADAVVNLSGHPVDSRWDDSVKRLLRASRVDTTEAIVEAVYALDEESRPETFVCASAVGVYGDRGDDVLTEDDPLGDDFLACLARDWEAAAEEAGGAGLRVVRVRTGVALGQAGVLPRMVGPMRLGVGGPLGDGRQWLSWVHIADLARLYRHAIETPRLEGAVNACAPHPVRMSDFAKTLGRVLHRPAWVHVSRSELHAVVGEVGDYMLMSQRLDPGKALTSGFEFAFPDLEPALRDLVPALR